MNQEHFLTLALCGDVMTGRGIDQILPHPGNPALYESCVRDARDYIKIAEDLNGPIRRPAKFSYIWGDALQELSQAHLRIVNLETSITQSNDCWADKGIHYRMNPANIECLTAARIDACSLANNHVVDWGFSGLLDTLETLDKAGIAHAGAGKNEREASAPAILNLIDGKRAFLFSLGSPTSGVPRDWQASQSRAGVNLLEDLSEASADKIIDSFQALKKPGDVVIASIHWGGNWGYDVPREQIAFAHRLIEGGVDIVHGHSSHHPKPIEIHQNRLILYGCGDFLNDYEGITGYEEYRGDLSLLYLAKLDLQTARLASLRLVPMQMKRFRLNRPSAEDAQWLCSLLNRVSARFNTHFQLLPDNSFEPGIQKV